MLNADEHAHPVAADNQSYAGIGCTDHIAFFLSLALVIIVVVVFHSDFFRPYTDTGQESLASANAHGLAYASLRDLDPLRLLFLAKTFNGDGGVASYPHYTNGFPLLLRATFALFGNSYLVARSVALLSVLIGAYLFVWAIRDSQRRQFGFFAIPLTLSTSIGRDTASFVFLEPCQFLTLGISAHFLFRQRTGPCGRAAVILLATSLYEVAMPFLLWASLSRTIITRNLRALIFDMIVLAVAISCVAAAFVFADGSLETGMRSLELILLQRTGIGGPEGTVSIAQVLTTLWDTIASNFGTMRWYLLLSFALALRFSRTEPLLTVPTVGFALYAMSLRNHVHLHLFTRLPLIFLLCVDLLVVTGVLLHIAIHNIKGSTALLVATLVASLSSLYVAHVPRVYVLDETVLSDHVAFTETTTRFSTLLPACARFVFHGVRTDTRISQYFLGPIYGAHYNERLPICEFDIAQHAAHMMAP